MALYLVSYDLRKQRDYQTLWDELRDFDAVRILESDWCFRRFNTTAVGLRDHFAQFIDADDGLFVVEMSESQGRGRNLLGSPNDLT